jgi:outer membrane protein TolC
MKISRIPLQALLRLRRFCLRGHAPFSRNAMRQTWPKNRAVFALALLLVAVPSLSRAQEPPRPDQATPIGFPPRQLGVTLDNPPPEPDLRVLPINLATALGLVGSQPIDVALAGERVKTAAAALEQARAYWLPTITLGGDYARHDGPFQDATGAIVNSSFSYFTFGAGSGIAAASVFSFDEAIFGPLAARQVVLARQADLQAVTNNTMLEVTDAYFTVQQARGDLAAAIDIIRRTDDVVQRVRKLAPGLVPPLEVTRAETELANRQDYELRVRERWQVASAELLRVLRLDGTAQVEPLEPPILLITLVDLHQPVDDLVAIGLTQRPELAAYQAEIQAALARVRQEKWRPFIPSLWIRGWTTQAASGSLVFGGFTGGPNGNFSSLGIRDDFDVQLLWQLDNLGFGNCAKVHLRQSQYRAMSLELQRAKDRVVAEVAQAYAQARQAARRTEVTEREVKLALESYEKNLVGIGQTKRAGELIITVVRPQELLAAIQALADAYSRYFQAVADSNRAQFRLYRALGSPAQLLFSQFPQGNCRGCSPAEAGPERIPGQ